MKEPLPKNKHAEKLIKSDNLFPVIGIGASAGGLDAFKKLLKAIPVNSGMAFVLVQHLDPNHESLLTEILQKVTPIPVLEIADDIKVEPNHVYVIPSNKIMVATDGVLQLAPRPEKSKTERYLPIDFFFNSLAIVHQTHAIGVVLSGTGTDGTLGLKAIKDNGGITLVQDEASAAYPDMPNSAIHAGVVDFTLPPEKIPEKLVEITQIITTNNNAEQNLPLEDEEAFKQINAVLRIRKGTDFTYYKQTTIRRRILRRMAINKNAEPAAYLIYLRENKLEQDLLYLDLLIPVTSFFRDSNVFDNLCANVLPLIIKNKPLGEPIRIWVAGCSTGEEAYSIAICIKEFLGNRTSLDTEERVQIFATDLSERAIIKARSGIYTKLEVGGLTPERLNEFFTKTNGNYQVNRQIRDLCVFATHNFLKDPPFGKMDIVSCRNVLIYMEPYLQKKAFTIFHYALNPKGFLLLGKSETTGGVPELFASTEKNDKLYIRKDAPSRFIHSVSPRTELNLIDTNDKPKTENMRSDFQKIADDIMLSKYSPAGVVINEAMDIVQFRGSTSRYLEQSSGKPSHNLLLLAKHGLAFELRNILHKTKKGKASVIKENVPVDINGNLVNINIEAIPLPNTIEPHYLILFHESNSDDTKQAINENNKPSRKSKTDDRELRIKQLELELNQAREDMRSITEDQEAANEELQSANEELLSGSEELQSLNEELETSKEELQSTNEELMVVNHEMISLNEQIAAARNYAESIVANIREPLLVLDKNLRVKTANKSFYKTFQINEKETEGILIYNLGDKQWDIPELRNLLEKILPEKSIFTDFEVTLSFPVIGERIMLLNAREVINKNTSEKLILLSIEDITEKAFAHKKIEESEKRYNMMLMKSPFAFAVLKGKNMVITLANDSVKEMWGKGRDLEGKPLLEVLPELKDSEFPSLLDNVYTTGTHFSGEELLAPVFRNGKLEDVYFNFVYQPYLEADETISGVTIIAIEVTNEVIAKQKIKDSQQQLQNIFMQAPFALNIYEGKELVISLANKLFCEIIGKTESEILGKKLFDAFPETATQGLDKILSDIFSTGIPFKGNEFPVHFLKHGNEFKGYFDFIYQPIFDYNKNVSGVINVAIDVTDKVLARKKVEESEEHFRLMADLMPSKISYASPDGSVTYFSKQWLDFSGYTFEELRDFGYQQIMHPDEMEEFEHRFQKAAETGTDLVMEMRFKNKQGDYIWHLNIASPIKDKNGMHKRWIGVTTEIHEQKTQAEKIKASEERFRLLVMQAPVAICVLRGEDFIFETINEEMANLLDRKIEDALNKPLFDVIAEVKDQVYKELLETVYKTGARFVSQELPLAIHRNGRLEESYVKFVYEPLREPDGNISGVMVLSDEITDQVNARKAIEVSEKKYRTLLTSIDQGFTLCEIIRNKKGKAIDFYMLEVNPTYEEQTGISKETVLGKKIIQTFPSLTKWMETYAAVVDNQCPVVYENYFEDTDRWFENKVYPVGKDKFAVLFRDITERKQYESKLIEAKESAENAAKSKQQFLSNMSHEIRTPMNAIIGFTNVLLKSKLDQAQEEYLKAIKVSGDALLVLINDILDLAKVDAGEMTFEQIPFNLATSLSAMLKLFDLKIKEKNLELAIQFDTAIPEIISGDPVRLRQIILNLVANAVKFTEVGKIAMRVSLLQQDAEKVTIEFIITDTGIGIHKNKLEHIFEDFGQATYENSRLYGGTGLGLAIVKKLIKLQGGTIHVESELGKGSVFSFQLSFAKTNQKIKHETEMVLNKQSEIKNIHILVAEDMPLNQLLIKIILADFGFEVDIADNGKKLRLKNYN